MSTSPNKHTNMTSIIFHLVGFLKLFYVDLVKPVKQEVH